MKKDETKLHFKNASCGPALDYYDHERAVSNKKNGNLSDNYKITNPYYSRYNRYILSCQC